MFLDANSVTINQMKNRALSEAYLNEYNNTFLLDPSVASRDYVTWLTRSLIERGYLYDNWKTLEFLHKAKIEEILSARFKDLFLYSFDRSLTGVYNDLEDVKKMGPVGNFDLLSSMIGLVNARLFPTFVTEPELEEEFMDSISADDIDDEEYVQDYIKFTFKSDQDRPLLTQLSQVIRFYKLVDDKFVRCNVNDFYITEIDGKNHYKFRTDMEYYKLVLTKVEDSDDVDDSDNSCNHEDKHGRRKRIRK